MNRFDFFFRQKVTEGELDAAFDAAENALFNFALDVGIVGITSGAAVAENAGTPNLTVDVGGPGSIYDQLGQRINWTGTQDVDCSVDENSNSTAVTTPGNEKWLSIFAKFERSLSDARLDGTGASVFFNRAESFTINVVQGAESVAPATRPSTRADEILLADVKLIFGQTQILNADIDITRREDWTNDASTIEFTGPSNNWHDGSNLATNTLDDLINALVDSLADESTDGKGGADRIGTRAKTVGSTALTAGSIDDQLVELATEIQDLKKSRVYQQMTAIRLHNNVFSGVAQAIKGMAFSNDANSVLASGVPRIMLVGDDGSTVKVIMAENLVQTSDVTLSLINSPDHLSDCIYIPNSNRFIVVGRLGPTTGAEIETCDDEVGTTFVSRTPTGMTASGDEATVIAYDSNNADVIVGGNNGNVIRSTNDGTTWAAATTVPAGVATYQCNHMVENGLGDVLSVWIKAASAAIVLHSSDGGDTWTDVTPGAVTADEIAQPVWEPNEQRWVLIEKTGNTYRSTNTAGTAWTAGASAPGGITFAGGAITDGASGVAVYMDVGGVGSFFYATDDLGVTLDLGFDFINDGIAGSGDRPVALSSLVFAPRGYYARGRFWFPYENDMYVTPAAVWGL